MLVGSCVVAASLTLGLIFGSIAGYYGGFTDRLLNVVVMNAFMSFPGILLAIAFVAFPGSGHLQSDLRAVDWRLGGLCAISPRTSAGRCGSANSSRRPAPWAASDLRIIGRHILPNIIQPVHGAGRDRHGRRDSGRGHDELPGIRRAAADSELGHDAERRSRSHLFDSPHLVLFPAPP